jgi:hypothetical protein
MGRKYTISLVRSKQLTPVYENQGGYNGGLELREYYASKAMQSLLARDLDLAYAELAQESFAVADAMIKHSTEILETTY